jgi:hypothetical protein
MKYSLHNVSDVDLVETRSKSESFENILKASRPTVQGLKPHTNRSGLCVTLAAFSVKPVKENNIDELGRIAEEMKSLVDVPFCIRTNRNNIHTSHLSVLHRRTSIAMSF